MCEFLQQILSHQNFSDRQKGIRMGGGAESDSNANSLKNGWQFVQRDQTIFFSPQKNMPSLQRKTFRFFSEIQNEHEFHQNKKRNGWQSVQMIRICFSETPDDFSKT
jgi:hypothetical protein